jgi:hypothetical protein
MKGGWITDALRQLVRDLGRHGEATKANLRGRNFDRTA